MKAENAILNKESEKAINVTFNVDGNAVTTWLPKSSATYNNGVLDVKDKFWKFKDKELRTTAKKTGNVVICHTPKETEKALGIQVTVYENISEQSITRMIWFPKSQVVDRTEKGIIVPAWLLNAKIEEVKDSAETGSFGRKSFEVEIEYAAI